MLESGSNNSLPAKYRITLALSTAIMLHTLLLSAVPPLRPDLPVEHRQTLRLNLTSPASHQAPPTTDSPQLSETAKKSSVPVPREHNSSPKPSSESSPNDHSPEPSPDRSTQASSNTSPTSSPSQPAPQPRSETDSTDTITAITKAPSEKDPYLIKLATHLARELEKKRVPAISELTDSNTLRLELQLLQNGALTRARVMKSTGIKQIDSAAYRAALSASPYPEPPGKQGDNSHFEVTLVFAPSRL